MATTIRLQRVGRNKQGSFRIVVADRSESRAGPAIATLGLYNPRTQPSLVQLDAAAALRWLREGARPTGTVRSLFKKTGVWQQFQQGVTPESVQQTEVTLGPAPGKRKTSARPATPRPAEPAPKAAGKTPLGAAEAPTAAEGPESPLAEAETSSAEPGDEETAAEPVTSEASEAAEVKGADEEPAPAAEVGGAEPAAAEADDEAEEKPAGS